MSYFNQRSGDGTFNEAAFAARYTGRAWHCTIEETMEAVREIFEAGEAYWIDLGTRVLKGVQNHTLTLIDQSFFEDLLVCRATYLQNPISLMDWYLPAFRRTTDCLEGADPVAGLDGYLVITNTLRMAMSGTYDTPSYSGHPPPHPRPATEGDSRPSDAPLKGPKLLPPSDCSHPSSSEGPFRGPKLAPPSDYGCPSSSGSKFPKGC